MVCLEDNELVGTASRQAGQMGICLTHLVRQSQGQLDLVGNSLSVSTALERSAEEGGTGAQGRTSKAKGAHCAMDEDAKAKRIPLEGCVAKVELGAGCSLVPGSRGHLRYVLGQRAVVNYNALFGMTTQKV